MKKAGLYSQSTNAIDVHLDKLLVLAIEARSTGKSPETAPRQRTELDPTLIQLADKNFFKNSDMGWVERDYAVHEAVRFHQEVIKEKA